MFNKKGMLPAGAMTLFFLIQGGSLTGQAIFRVEKPVIQAVWHRVADYSPTLRSVETAEFSPDGRHIVSGAKFGNYLMFWSVADGDLLWEKVLEAEVEAVTFSPDGRYIAAGDEAYRVTIYDLEGNVVKILQHDAAFDGITWSPDGMYVAAGSENGKVVLWRSGSWQLDRMLEAGNTVNSLQFSSDMKYLIAAGNKMNRPGSTGERHGFAKAWKVDEDFRELFEIRAQERSTKSVRFHPSEKQFAVAGFANQVKIFSFPEAEELAVIDLPEKLEAIAYHPEGNFLFAGGHGDHMHIYHTSDYREVDTLPCRRVEYIDFSSDGRLMVTGHEDSGMLSLWLFWSKMQEPGQYDRLSREILKNRDLQDR